MQPEWTGLGDKGDTVIEEVQEQETRETELFSQPFYNWLEDKVSTIMFQFILYSR